MTWTWFLPAVSLFWVLVFYGGVYLNPGPRLRRFRIADRQAPVEGYQVRFSLYSLGIAALFGAMIDLLAPAGITRLDWSGNMPWWALGLQLLAMFLFNDAYFYWTHRLLHTRWLFRKVHSWHHRSHQINPWVAFSFHPVEGLLQFGFIPLLALLPFDGGLLMGFVAFTLMISVYGHLGFEFRAEKHPVFFLFNTTLHHHQHHTRVRGNYGLYLTVWDKAMGTLFPDYYEEIQRFIRKGKTTER